MREASPPVGRRVRIFLPYGQVEAVKLREYMALADEFATHCAHKACYGEEYPPQKLRV
jgi:hypothetical protein